MSILIIWAIMIGYAVVAIRLIPMYYRRVDAYNAKEYPYMHKGGMEKSTAFAALMLCLVWPFYELGRLALNYVIRAASNEQRAWDEYKKKEGK